MEPTPTAEAVLLAIRTLLHSQSKEEREHADKWLKEYQKSIYAWSISDQLIRQKLDVESCYMASQTMRTKIQRYFNELPANTHINLRDSLLEHLLSCDTTSFAAVITQLCLALADLALLMGTWQDAVADILQRFDPHPQSYPVLLELLTVLPEEINSSHLRLGRNRRNELVHQFTRVFPVVHKFLLSSLQQYQSDVTMCAKILRCLGSWFSLGAVPEEIIMESQLLQAVIYYLSIQDTNSSSQLHEAASDCLCSALYCCEDLGKYGNLAEALYNYIITLDSAYQYYANESDLDRCLSYARIFTEMAESFTQVIIYCPNKGLGGFRQLDLICATVDNSFYEVSEICFNFWFNLAEKIFSRDDPEFNTLFAPYIQRLILALCHHSELSADLEGILSRNDDFYDFRSRVSELIRDTVFIPQSNVCFNEMLRLLNDPSRSTWQAFEAPLFVMSSIAAYVKPDQEHGVQCTINLIIRNLCNPLGKLHVMLDYTCIVVLGQLSEWIAKHTQHLDEILPFLLSCLYNEDLATAAATALDDICSCCASKQKMKDNFPTMLQVVQHVDSFNIPSSGTIKLVKAVASILATFPEADLPLGVRTLCSYQVEPLAMLVQSTEQTKIKRGSEEDPGFWVDRLTSVIRYGVPPTYINGTHPCYEVMTEIWPVITAVCKKYQKDGGVLEKCCRCIRFVVRNIGRSFSPLLESLVTTMVELYSNYQHACLLYLASILVDVFVEVPDCLEGLLGMTQYLAQPTFVMLGQPNGLVDHPDTIDDFFRLCKRFLQKGRIPFVASAMMNDVINCGVAACTIQHREANESVMAFLTELLRVDASLSNESQEKRIEYEQVHTILQQHGQSLSDALLQACVEALPSYMMETLADVFMALLTFDRNVMSTFLSSSLSKLPRQTSGGVVTAKEEQISDFLRGIIKSTNERDIEQLLRDFLRLYR